MEKKYFMRTEGTTRSLARMTRARAEECNGSIRELDGMIRDYNPSYPTQPPESFWTEIPDDVAESVLRQWRVR